MNIEEIIQQPGTKERMLKEDILKSLNVAIPGEIISYNADSRTASIQPVIREWNNSDTPAILPDVPVFFCGNFTFTPQKGDGCLVVCADRSIDSWVQSGGVSTPMSARVHSLSDGFAFVGFRQTNGVDLPELLKPATWVKDGLMSKEDKRKLDEGGGGGGGGGGGTTLSRITFDIQTSAWTAITGGYSASVTDTRIGSTSDEIVTYDESIEGNLPANITAEKDAANHAMVFKVSSVPTGEIRGSIFTFSTYPPASAVFDDVDFSIATTDWTGDAAPYSAELSSDKFVAGCGIWVFWSSSYDSYSKTSISATVSSGKVTFSTNTKPTGAVGGFIRAVCGVNGTVPIVRGGTGGTTADEALTNLGIGDAREKLDLFSVVDGKLCITYYEEV